MYKTLVYTLVNGNIQEPMHREQQKSQKVIITAETNSMSLFREF